MATDTKTAPEMDDAPAEVAEDTTVTAFMQLSYDVYAHAASTDPSENEALKTKILAEVERARMAPYYEALCARFGWTVDTTLLDKLRKDNEEELKKLEAGIADAKERQGDVEVAEAITKKAEYYMRIGDKESALRVYGEVPSKPLSTGQKIDIAMARIRLALFHGDTALATAQLAAAKELNERGGDWDRRNRLKVYEGVMSLLGRDFATASQLLLDSISTFTATDILSYPSFIFYTVLVTLKCLERPVLKKKVIDSPDVLAVINDIPHLSNLLNAFYEGRYAAFLASLSALHGRLLADRFLSHHAAYYLREMRIAAYAQFLESYKSVSMAGMARTFGVSVGFLDKDVARFIAAGRLHAQIDAVAGVIETNRPDSKNAQYAAVIKHGDALLNKIQRLSRVVAI